MAAQPVPQYRKQSEGVFAEPDTPDRAAAQAGAQSGYGGVSHHAETDDTGAGQGKGNPQLAGGSPQAENAACRNKGIFKGRERKELETKIQRTEEKISAMLEELPEILKEDGYPDVRAFMATYRKAEAVVEQYNRELVEWERKVREKGKPAEKEQAAPPRRESVLKRLRQLQAEGRTQKSKCKTHDMER